MDYTAWYREIQDEKYPEVWVISVGCTPDFSTSVADWRDFLINVVRLRTARWPDRQPMTTYAWHDEQACQLRFASDDCTPEDVPFGCKIELVDSPDGIIASWLAEPSFIPWQELSLEDPDAEIVEIQRPPLKVWAVQHSKH